MPAIEPSAPSRDADEDIWEVWWCYDGWHGAADRLERILPSWARLHRMNPSRPLVDQVRNARVLVPTTGQVDRAVIFAAADLRLIAQPAAGYNSIDVAAARERSVPITHAPGYGAAAVAEIAVCMMLMLSRRIDEARAAFAARIIGEPAAARTLAGKTLGIVGMGRVGRQLATIAEAMDMRVLGVTSTSAPAELDALLAASDVVSLHVPLTPRTTGLIGARELALMKPGALLINVARGPVVHKAALLAALESGHLGGAGLDCHEIEPADPSDPIYAHPRVLALPHVGATTQEVYDAVAAVLRDNIVACREGGPLKHELREGQGIAHGGDGCGGAKVIEPLKPAGPGAAEGPLAC